jgi:hypothetical protein
MSSDAYRQIDFAIFGSRHTQDVIFYFPHSPHTMSILATAEMSSPDKPPYNKTACHSHLSLGVFLDTFATFQMCAWRGCCWRHHHNSCFLSRKDHLLDNMDAVLYASNVRCRFNQKAQNDVKLYRLYNALFCGHLNHLKLA